MTQEEKAKAYDEALKKAQKLVFDLPNGREDRIYHVSDLESIFPELKCKDERILNCIRISLTDVNEQRFKDYGTTLKDCLAWLEKQGKLQPTDKIQVSDELYEHIRNTCACIDDALNSETLTDINDYLSMAERSANSAFDMIEKQGGITELSEEEQNRFAKGVLTRCALSFIDYLDAHKYEGKMCVSNGECEDIENAFHNAMWDRLYRYYCKYIKKQGEHDNSNIKDYNSIDPYFGKPIDKVEPKFHEGEWVVQGDNILKIKCVGDTYYCFETVGGYVDDMLVSEIENQFHLWTIQDAKDGDVLYSKEHNLLWLHKDSKQCYSCINLNYNNISISTDIIIPKDVYPATKEQREFLFQKMKNAGYEWDFEKNELKKIEQKSTNKVEPKFHEGDWVVTDNCDTVQIVRANPGFYTLDNGKEFCTYYIDKYWHLWTIQDAKDGDVLFLDLINGKTFIYNGVNPDMSILYSFIISNDGEDVLPYHIGKPNTGIGNIEESKNIIYPATKEQRKLLFQKMKEAGYEWDEEKKELKLLITNGGDFFESENCKQNHDLSEGDKDIINCLIAICKGAKKFIQFESCSQEDIAKCQDWLTFLKNKK